MCRTDLNELNMPPKIFLNAASIDSLLLGGDG
jgi:hypothetical protein